MVTKYCFPVQSGAALGGIDLKVRFSTLAYRKYMWGLKKSNNEIGFYGISSVDDPLYIEDLSIPKQEVSGATFEFDDEGVAAHLYEWRKKGKTTAECCRIMLHTHPGDSCTPSGTDESEFVRVYGEYPWSLMIIMGQSGKMYARYRQKEPVVFSAVIPVVVEFEVPGVGDELVEGWDKQYNDRVSQKTHMLKGMRSSLYYRGFYGDDEDDYVGVGRGRTSCSGNPEMVKFFKVDACRYLGSYYTLVGKKYQMVELKHSIKRPMDGYSWGKMKEANVWYRDLEDWEMDALPDVVSTLANWYGTGVE